MPDVAERAQRLERAKFKPEQILAAQLMGQGRTAPQVATLLKDRICPRTPESKRMKAARARIRHWLRRESFRDLVYEYALVNLETEIPSIFKGVAKKAKAGRVDAARLVLEVTGRHTTSGEAPPAVVQVNFGELPRPVSREADVTYDEDEVIEDDGS